RPQWRESLCRGQNQEASCYPDARDLPQKRCVQRTCSDLTCRRSGASNERAAIKVPERLGSLGEASLNLDERTVSGFGDEWRRFDQSRLSSNELYGMFNAYFNVFPWSALPTSAEGFDL